MAKFEIVDGVCIIPNGVRIIESDAFKREQIDMSSFSSVEIPSSVTEIGDFAFSDCISLTSIKIPSSVVKIGMLAFNCSKLVSIEVAKGNGVYDSREDCNAIIETATNKLVVGCGASIIPDSVLAIANYAFHRCETLKNIVIPDNVVEIGECAFFKCLKLKSVVLSPNLTKICNSTFASCKSLVSIEIPSKVKSIGLLAFYGCKSLAEIRIHSRLNEIADGAFADCKSLTNIEFTSSMLLIFKKLFMGVSLSDIPTLGNLELGKEVFENCNSLKVIKVPKNETEYFIQRFPTELHSLIVESEN